ncbi:hypothetical protein, partial [Dietzia sp. 179-F 9C3 NHS]|uniref:hypothetical protein n=1 Tax=Dietzia sp. 179-F 9C3 NHS TaxID=3374295 RepID=UPI0038798F24
TTPSRNASASNGKCSNNCTAARNRYRIVAAVTGAATHHRAHVTAAASARSRSSPGARAPARSRDNRDSS